MAENPEVKRTDEEWKKILSAEQYTVLRMKGTERPFSGEFLRNKSKGAYVCAACGNDLFRSEAKYDSGSGWPSFWEITSDDGVREAYDGSLGMERTEVMCAKCGGHLGHVFDDGPRPTGRRYCVNSVSLRFVPDEDEQ